MMMDREYSCAFCRLAGDFVTGYFFCSTVMVSEVGFRGVTGRECSRYHLKTVLLVLKTGFLYLG